MPTSNKHRLTFGAVLEGGPTITGGVAGIVLVLVGLLGFADKQLVSGTLVGAGILAVVGGGAVTATQIVRQAAVRRRPGFRVFYFLSGSRVAEVHGQLFGGNVVKVKTLEERKRSAEIGVGGQANASASLETGSSRSVEREVTPDEQQKFVEAETRLRRNQLLFDLRVEPALPRYTKPTDPQDSEQFVYVHIDSDDLAREWEAQHPEPRCTHEPECDVRVPFDAEGWTGMLHLGATGRRTHFQDLDDDRDRGVTALAVIRRLKRHPEGPVHADGSPHRGELRLRGIAIF